MDNTLKTTPDFCTRAIFFEFLRKENPLVSFCTMHFTGGFKKFTPRGGCGERVDRSREWALVQMD